MRTTVLLLLLSILGGVLLVVYDLIPSFALSAEELELLLPTFWTMIVVSFLCFVISEITKNYSQTDKLWNLMPAVYAWIFAYQAGFCFRSNIMAILVTLWSIRITFNFWRRGGFPKNLLKFWSGEEDYRWKHLQASAMFQDKNGSLSKTKWSIFNLLFVSYYQHILIWLFTLPAYKVMVSALDHSAKDLGIFDVIAGVLVLGFLLLEFIADQQQYNYQTEKHRRINAGEDLGIYSDGFCRTGLWKISRHPNFMAEQAIWACFYLFSVASTGLWINNSIIGIILLMLLFQGSANFSESISMSKYPKYKEYQRQVGKFIPRPARKR